jgi:hypothetical protein
VAISVSAEKDPRERGERYETREPARVEEVHNFLFEVLEMSKTGVKGSNLESSRCWCGIVLELTREFQTQAPSAACGFATPPRKVQPN